MFGVVFEFRLQRFFEGDGFGCDHVDQRATLLAWEYAAIDAGCQVLLAKNQSGARSAQCFMRCGGDDMRVRDWGRMHSGRDEAGKVRHVDDEERADFVGNLAHAGKVEGAGIGAAAANDHLGLFALGNLFELVVVDDLGILADAVAGDAVQLAGKIQLVAVGEVAAMRQVEAEDGIAGLNNGHVGGGVGLRAGVRLHVRVLGAEELFGAVARQIFHHVGILAAAVVALAGVALRIFIGEDGTGRLQHRLADKIL